MGRLIATVHVAGQIFKPGDDVPEKFARLMGAHCFEGRQHPFPDAPTVTNDGGSGESIPPKAGRGSSRDAWAAYAAKHDVPVANDLARDDIIDVLATAGVPTVHEQ